MITIIDYEAGNLSSIRNMLKKAGHDSVISGKVIDIETADKLILPGVGSYDYGMNQLKEKGLLDVINQKAMKDKVPFLGICLGMQLMTRSSEEGQENGLGWFDAKTVRFDINRLDDLKIPHMGWNEVHFEKNIPLINNLPPEPRYYFVHSFHAVSHTPEIILGTATYGYSFTCALQKENIIGVQFHPEKSHVYGLKLLQNFASS